MCFQRISTSPLDFQFFTGLGRLERRVLNGSLGRYERFAMFTTQRGDPLLQILRLLTRSIDLHAGALLDGVNMLGSGGALGAGRCFLGPKMILCQLACGLGLCSPGLCRIALVG